MRSAAVGVVPGGVGMKVTFRVEGTPVPQGSTRSFVPKGWKRAITTAANTKTKPWRADVAAAAITAVGRLDPLPSGPIGITLAFEFSRPKSHYGTGKKAAVLKATAPTFHTSKPDGDKLVRAIFDALTGICYRDDSQVALQRAEKRYTTGAPGVTVEVRTLNHDDSEESSSAA